MPHNPYYSDGNYPPPLFVAELDSNPSRPDEVPSHHAPDGAPVFEMPGDPAPAKPSDEKLPSGAQSPAQQPGHANSSPFSVENHGQSPPAQHDTKDKPTKTDPAVSPPHVMANPWAYFGPESSGDVPAPLAIASGRRPAQDEEPRPPQNHEQ
ncbi:hypothetical protein FDECE_18551, partial [Fusarium decemcellulare]